MIEKAFEIRLYPNLEQEQKLMKTFGSCRFVYNNSLAQMQKTYKENGKSKKPSIPELKTQYEWLNEIECCALQQSQRDLDKAFSNWFNSLKGKTKQKSKAPKFKKRSDKQSFRTVQMPKNLKFLLKKIKRLKYLILDMFHLDKAMILGL